MKKFFIDLERKVTVLRGWLRQLKADDLRPAEPKPRLPDKK
jgi:hypothetical protein